ncbi:hypothetical protein C8R43DRAFT_945127 [Mycena crocata]|nr:hypothetical protein C8R43DRAFT_945127 [Mycena crocata]
MSAIIFLNRDFKRQRSLIGPVFAHFPMPRRNLTEPPPPYTAATAQPARLADTDIADLFGSLSIATRSSSVQTSSRARRRLAPPPVLTPAPAVTQDPDPLYSYETSQSAGFTNSWVDAAHQTQGVPGGTPHLIIAIPKKRTKNGAFAIFRGTHTGAFESWYDEVKPFVIGVSGSLYQGYRTLDLARAAFDYALQRGWTHICPSPPSRYSLSVLAPRIPALPEPIGLIEAVNPLHSGSAMEGRCCATFDSCTTRATAVARFQAALLDGRVRVVHVAYS